MTYGQILRGYIEERGLSKTYICEKLGVSRPYLYSVFAGTTPPPVPEKQLLLTELLGLSHEESCEMFDLAAQERGEAPADITLCVQDPETRSDIRRRYVYAVLNISQDGGNE